MTSRAKQKDTDADRSLSECIASTPPQSFLMIAGAGSGKTTSLIKGLTGILSKHGDKLKLRRQRVACITYTEIAAEEIWADVGSNPLVHVSTIHSFLWSLVKSFQADIKAWVASRIESKIAELQNTAATFGPRVQKRTREKNASDIVRYQQQGERLRQIRSFTYGTGSDYVNGVLGHDDIIKMVPQLISTSTLMRRLVAQQFPILFVDESQDTAENVVDALKAVDEEFGKQFCVGFFGDPMQRIYMTGIGEILPSPGWATITKVENFRCPTAVLNVANAIRRDGDGLVQTCGRMEGPVESPVPVRGSANIVILPINERRDQYIAQVRAWAARQTGDDAWNIEGDRKAVKVLVIVHRMAAKRLGFGNLYAALNDKAPETFKNGFLDGTAWPVRPFIRFIIPLVSALKSGNEFEAIQVLRKHSPLLARESISKGNAGERLAELVRFTNALVAMIEPDSRATVADALRHVHDAGAIPLDPRLLSYLKLRVPLSQVSDRRPPAEEEDDGEELTKEISAMDAFLACPASECWGYYDYLNDDSPFSTQQGIKGAEFDRVLVILDDDEGTHVQFSYDKYLGIRELSEKDLENRLEGKETTVERTRRLFYVCCTRALKDLVVVLFASDVVTARARIAALGQFPTEAIHTQEELAGL